MAGGGAPTQQNVSTTTSNLPEYARPYFENVVNRAQAQSYQPYTPYPNQRIAGFTPAQEQVQQSILGMGSPGQFALGSGLAATAAQGSMYAANYNPTQITAQQIGMPVLQQYRMDGPESFTAPGTAGRYMSPYMQQVLDVQKSEAIRDAQKDQLSANLASARSGTYGGARQTLAMTERERNLAKLLGDIEATGMQSSYQAASDLFGREQAAKQATGQTNLQAALGTQQLGVNAGLEALRSNQQSTLEAQRLAEQSKQFGATTALGGYQQAGQLAQTLGNLGQYQQQADLSRLNAQQGAAGQGQALEQQYLDQMYADFLRQRDYPMEQLGYFNNILRGLPVGLNTTQTTYAPPPSLASQVIGTGLGGLGLYNTMKG